VAEYDGNNRSTVDRHDIRADVIDVVIVIVLRASTEVNLAKAAYGAPG